MNIFNKISILCILSYIVLISSCCNDSETVDVIEESTYTSVDCSSLSSELNFVSLCMIDPIVVPESNDNMNCQILTFTSDMESQIYILSIGINNTVDVAKSNYETDTQLAIVGAENIETTAVDNLGDEAKVQDYSVEDDNYLYLRIRKSNAVVTITSLLENGQTLCSHDTSEMISLAQQVLDKL